MKKGDLVRLSLKDDTIRRHFQTNREHFDADRPITREERDEWYQQKRNDIAEARKAGEDTFHIAFDDGGESRLPPTSVSVPLALDGIFIVQRARCRAQLGWGNKTGGLTKILDTSTGKEAYIKREMLEVINEC